MLSEINSPLQNKGGNFKNKLSSNKFFVAELAEFHTYTVSDTHLPKVDFAVNIEAIVSGWGASDGDIPTGIVWKSHDKSYHVSYFERRAIQLAIVVY